MFILATLLQEAEVLGERDPGGSGRFSVLPQC